jgi:hypothetical protein
VPDERLTRDGQGANARVAKTVNPICVVASPVVPSAAATVTTASIATRSDAVRRNSHAPEWSARSTPETPGRSGAPEDRAARTAMTT